VIDSLLFLAKAEQAQMQIRREKIDLVTEIENLVEFYEASAAEEKLEIQVSVEPSLTLHAERTLFQRVLSNLLTNAIAYNRPGGQIRISAERKERGVEISVADTGEGISQVDLPLVFDRFFRADPSRKATKIGGFGLGLTIVKTIVSLHQGKVHIQSEPNLGTTVRVYFPAEMDRI
jgi:signal transduction histidine kinase